MVIEPLFHKVFNKSKGLHNMNEVNPLCYVTMMRYGAIKSLFWSKTLMMPPLAPCCNTSMHLAEAGPAGHKWPTYTF